MKINDSILIKFINNDLTRSEKNKVQLLISRNPKIKSRIDGLLNFRSILKEESKTNKKIRMPKSLYKRFSFKQSAKKNFFSSKLSNFYKVAAGILVFASISWLVTMPNKAFLSQKGSLLNDNYYTDKIFYSKSERDEFLLKYNNCKKHNKKKTFDQNDKEVFPVICRLD